MPSRWKNVEVANSLERRFAATGTCSKSLACPAGIGTGQEDSRYFAAGDGSRDFVEPLDPGNQWRWLRDRQRDHCLSLATLDGLALSPVWRHTDGPIAVVRPDQRRLLVQPTIVCDRGRGWRVVGLACLDRLSATPAGNSRWLVAVGTSWICRHARELDLFGSEIALILCHA